MPDGNRYRIKRWGRPGEPSRPCYYSGMGGETWTLGRSKAARLTLIEARDLMASYPRLAGTLELQPLRSDGGAHE